MAGKNQYCGLSQETLKKIKEARLEKGLSQQQMADNIDKTRLTYLRLENGKMNVISETLQEVCNELDLVPYLFLYDKGGMAPDIGKMQERIASLEAMVEHLQSEIKALRKENLSLERQVELYEELRRKNN